MSNEDDDLDLRVREFLSARLDAQRGRASRAFDEMIDRQRRRRWMIAGASSLIAASVLVAAGIAWWPTEGAPKQLVADDASAPRDVQQVVAWQARDDGTMVLDNRIPVRRVQSETVEEVKWFDPQLGSTLRLTIPREQTILVKQDIY